MTGTSVFLDTNVFLYSVDRSEPEKQERAIAVIDRLTELRSGVASAQVVAETISASRRLRAPITQHELDRVVDSMGLTFGVLPINAAVVSEALRCWRRYSISYWDAQIWAAARIGGVDVIVSEDCLMPELEGARYVNPFTEGFSIEDLDLG